MARGKIMNDNLPELRDIHLPDESLFLWPLSYGWWLIFGSILGVIILYYGFSYYKRKSKKYYALKMLSKLDISNFSSAAKMSEILRRICVYKYPQAATLLNDKWLEFLNSHSHSKLGGTSASLLINAPYMSPQKTTSNIKDMQELLDFCRKWIGENL